MLSMSWLPSTTVSKNKVKIVSPVILHISCVTNLHTPHEYKYEYAFVFVGFVFGLWGKYSLTEEYPLLNMGQASVRRTNTLSKTWGKYSSMDEYPLKNMGQVFVHGRIRIPSQNMGQVFVHGRIRPQKHGQVFVHGRIPSAKHGQVFVWTNTL